MRDHILITGGAGFVGSSLALMLKQDFPASHVVALDNLKRRGSELNVARLVAAGVDFIHGDIRIPDDLSAVRAADLVIDCAAEPSVTAGYGREAGYLIHTNLGGTINCLELARRRRADVIFISTSRVYPIQPLRELKLAPTETRLDISGRQAMPGASRHGIAERFPLQGARSLYGASKLASELLLAEYQDLYGIKGVVNRCGVLTGPWQMGKVDQGFCVHWVARHMFGGELAYFGYGGTGKQVRDILHVRDLYGLVRMQIEGLDRHAGQTYNVGGGRKGSLSLLELTALCREITGRRVPIARVLEDRRGDIPWYVSDCRRVRSHCGWQPQVGPREIVAEIAAWIGDHRERLRGVLSP